jgi:ssDNA-binding replication factor A large subunit
VGDPVRVYLAKDDPDAEHHGKTGRVAERLRDSLGEETERPLDDLSYRIRVDGDVRRRLRRRGRSTRYVSRRLRRRSTCRGGFAASQFFPRFLPAARRRRAAVQKVGVQYLASAPVLA